MDVSPPLIRARLHVTATTWCVALPALVAFLLARTAMLPGLGLWDTGEYQTVTSVLGTAHPTGFPAYVVAGFLFSHLAAPLGNPAFLMNLFSACLLSLACALTADLTRRLTGSAILGLATGVGLALTPLVWNIGTAADAHALHLALIAALIWTLVRWTQAPRVARSGRWLFLASVLYGIALANHMLTVLLAPAIAVYVLTVEPRILWRRPRLVVSCALAVVGSAALLYLELPLRAGLFRAPLVYAHPETWSGFLYVVLGQQFQNGIDLFGDLDQKLAALAPLAQAQFGALALLIPAGLLATCLRAPRYALFSILVLVPTLLFAASYNDAAIDRYYLVPALLIWTWLAFAGLVFAEWIASFLAPLVARAGAGAPTTFAAFVALVLLAAALLTPPLLAAPTTFAALDHSHDTYGQDWTSAALAQLPPQAVVVSWWSYSTGLWYAQDVEGLRTDISIIDDRTRLDQDLGSVEDVVNANLPKRPVFVIRPSDDEIHHLANEYRLRQMPGTLGNVYEVQARPGSTP